MNTYKNIRNKKFLTGGFTLIELLVVIAIIGLLASIVLVNLKGVRERARDAVRQSDFKAISTALYMFYDQFGRMPANYSPFMNMVCEGSRSYERSMQELVDARLLGAIPRDPGGGVYCYADMGPGNQMGAIMITFLETYQGTEGLPPSCRPWDYQGGLCCRSNNNSYCICNPY